MRLATKQQYLLLHRGKKKIPYHQSPKGDLWWQSDVRPRTGFVTVIQSQQLCVQVVCNDVNYSCRKVFLDKEMSKCSDDFNIYIFKYVQKLASVYHLTPLLSNSTHNLHTCIQCCWLLVKSNITAPCL